MTWTQLRYGMAVVTAGTAVTGTLIWFGGGRETIEQIDVVEVWQATSERGMATQFTNGPANIATNTYKQMYVGGADPSGLAWVLNRTNGPLTNAYVSVTWSNAVSVWTNLPGSFRAPPPYFYWTFHDGSTTQRFLWGAWSNVTVAGVATVTNYNGTYDWFRRAVEIVPVATANMYGYDMTARVMVDYYRMINGAVKIIRDVGPMDQSPQANVGPASVMVTGSTAVVGGSGYTLHPGIRMDYAQWTNRTPTIVHGAWPAASIALGPLMPSRIRYAWT